MPLPSSSQAAKVAEALSRDVHYTVDEKQKSVLLTEDGYEAVEDVLQVGCCRVLRGGLDSRCCRVLRGGLSTQGVAGCCGGRTGPLERRVLVVENVM